MSQSALVTSIKFSSGLKTRNLHLLIVNAIKLRTIHVAGGVTRHGWVTRVGLPTNPSLNGIKLFIDKNLIIENMIGLILKFDR